MKNIPEKKPELLSPAGDWPSLISAIAGGADSVYFGVKGINMRHLAANFDIGEIGKVMDTVRDGGKKDECCHEAVSKDLAHVLISYGN